MTAWQCSPTSPVPGRRCGAGMRQLAPKRQKTLAGKRVLKDGGVKLPVEAAAVGGGGDRQDGSDASSLKADDQGVLVRNNL
jgi:hypothetical protein